MQDIKLGIRRLRNIDDSSEARYDATVRFIMRRDIRDKMADYFAHHSSSLPAHRSRDALAMILCGLAPTQVLDMGTPADMCCRHAAETFLEEFESRHDLTMCIQEALEAFRIWKQGSREDIRYFSADTLVRYRLKSTEAPQYWLGVHRSAGGNEGTARALFEGPLQRRPPPAERPTNLTQLHHYVAECVVHPLLQQYVSRAAPNRPVNDDEARPFLARLAQIAALFAETEVEPTMEGILDVFSQ